MSDRKIDMIISGGVNIYPAEIEGVLVTHPAVADAAVFGIPNDEFGEEVKAVVELATGYAASDGARGGADRPLPRSSSPATRRRARSTSRRSCPRAPTGKLMKRLLRDRYWQNTGRAI